MISMAGFAEVIELFILAGFVACLVFVVGVLMYGWHRRSPAAMVAAILFAAPPAGLIGPAAFHPPQVDPDDLDVETWDRRTRAVACAYLGTLGLAVVSAVAIGFRKRQTLTDGPSRDHTNHRARSEP